MPRQNEGLEKFTVRLDPAHVALLKQFYPRVGYNRAIRLIVSNHVKFLEQQVSSPVVSAEIRARALKATEVLAAPQTLLEDQPDGDAA